MIENEWRAEHCPDYGYLTCYTESYCPICEGAWSCGDILVLSEEYMAVYDANNDG